MLSRGTFSTIEVPGAGPFGINRQGDIVGYYAVDMVSHGFVLSGGVFTTIDFPGAGDTYAYGNNNRGDIVGSYFDGLSHAFVMTRGTFTTIDFPGAELTVASGINTRGDIVGVYRTGGVEHGFLLARDETCTP